MSPIKVDAKHSGMGQVPTRGGSVNIDGKGRKCWHLKSNVYDTQNTIKTFQKTQRKRESVNIDGERRKCWNPKFNIHETHNTINTFQKTKTAKLKSKTKTKC